MEVNRIRELLEARHLSPTQFADLIGVGRPVISHILSGRNEPSLKVVRSIIEAFPDVSLSWIMTGNGSMLANSALPPVETLDSTQGTPLAQAPPVVATAPPAGPPPALTAPGPLPQPQAFVAYNASPAPTARLAATGPLTAHPLPPKFRPGSSKSTEVLPPPAATAPISPIESVPQTAPSAVATSTPAAFVAPPVGAVQPVSAVSLDSYGPIAPSLEYQQQTSLASQPVQPTLDQAPVAPVTVSTTLSATAPSPPNPAAALSFLGEPGKAIRRIVIFYRDGSFGDYVPEGQ